MYCVQYVLSRPNVQSVWLQGLVHPQSRICCANSELTGLFPWARGGAPMSFRTPQLSSRCSDPLVQR